MQRTRVNAMLFHNMANWLPEAERDSLRAVFLCELERLQGAQAATGSDSTKVAAFEQENPTCPGT